MKPTILVVAPGASLDADQLAAVGGQQTLLVSNTSQYSWIYDDKGSGASMDVTLYAPVPTPPKKAGDPEFKILGHMAQKEYGPAQNTSLIVSSLNDTGDTPLLKAPTGFVQVWNDHGSGGRNDGSIWHPVAPDGYIAIGAIAAAGYDQPDIAKSNYVCIRMDLLDATNAGELIWNDQKSGAHGDVELFSIAYAPGLFLAQDNYSAPTGIYYTLQSQKPKQ